MFIQMVQGACKRQTEMRALVDDWCSGIAEQHGWLGGTYGFTDDDRFVGIVRFTNSEHCVEAARRPGAAASWAAAMDLLDGPCEIHQSDDVTLMFGGGTDEASFVQVMHGRLRDADRLRHLLSDQEMTTMLHQSRPEILGATLAIEPDGTFTETVAFTDELLARRGESRSMPESVITALDEAIEEMEYLDLHDPWFATHR